MLSDSNIIADRANILLTNIMRFITYKLNHKVIIIIHRINNDLSFIF
jgi:hypothetical protein